MLEKGFHGCFDRIRSVPFLYVNLCTEWNVHLVECFRGWKLDQSKRTIPLNGAILYRLRCAAFTCLDFPRDHFWRLDLSFLLMLPLSCSHSHHRTERLCCIDGCGFNCKWHSWGSVFFVFFFVYSPFFDVHHIYIYIYINLITVCFYLNIFLLRAGLNSDLILFCFFVKWVLSKALAWSAILNRCVDTRVIHCIHL